MTAYRRPQILNGTADQPPSEAVSALSGLADLVLLGEWGIRKVTVINWAVVATATNVMRMRKLIYETVEPLKLAIISCDAIVSSFERIKLAIEKKAELTAVKRVPQSRMVITPLYSLSAEAAST